MKDIKFRAIVPGINTAVYFTLEDFIEPLFSIRKIVIPFLKFGGTPDMYIGIKDKNNKEIYKGDIIRWRELVEDCIRNDYIVGVVEYSDEAAHFWVNQLTEGKWISKLEDYVSEFDTRFYDEDGQQFNWEDVEVIGNKYENPELLKKYNTPKSVIDDINSDSYKGIFYGVEGSKGRKYYQPLLNWFLYNEKKNSEMMKNVRG